MRILRKYIWIISNNGIGLGLALTKSSIDMHGEEITVKRDVGKGTEFEVKFMSDF